LVIPLTYFLLLPRPHVFSAIVLPDIEDNTPSTSEYTQLPVSEEDAGEAVADSAPLKTKAISIGEKWQLLKPLLPRYMAPLCMSSYFYVCTFDQMTHGTARPVFVYLVSFHPLLYASRMTVAKFEYTINQGVAPTLVYPIPTLETSPVFGHIIHSIRDYYPLWQVRCLLFCFILSVFLKAPCSLCTKVPYFSLVHPSPLGCQLFQHAQFQYPQLFKGFF
jgi:battenin